jgi:DNA repair exonuclease SbcCD ATPase subunit
LFWSLKGSNKSGSTWRKCSHKIDEEIAHVQKKRENLLAVKAQLEQLKSQKQTIQRQIETDRKDLSDFERQRQQWQKVLSQEAQIVEEWRKFLQVQQTEEILSEKLKRLRELEQKRHQLEQIILRAKAELENKLRANERDAANIEQRLAELKRLIARRSEVERQLEELRKAREMLRDWEWKQRQWQNLQQERMVLEQKLLPKGLNGLKGRGNCCKSKSNLKPKPL